MAFRGGSPARRAMACNNCGQMFFPASLKFHQKSCMAEAAHDEVTCQYCNTVCFQYELQTHTRSCEHLAQYTGAGAGHYLDEDLPLHPDTSEEQRRAQSGRRAGGAEWAEPWGDSEDEGTEPASGFTGGLVPCSVCHRTFAIERLAKHTKICRGASGRKARHAFDSSKQRLSGLNPVERNMAKPAAPKPPQQMIKVKMRSPGHGAPASPSSASSASPQRSPSRSSPPPPTIIPRRHSNDNQTPNSSSPAYLGGYFHSNQMRTGLKARQEPGLVSCPHCMRTFGAEAAVSHVPTCRGEAPKAPARAASPVYRAASPGYGAGRSVAGPGKAKQSVYHSASLSEGLSVVGPRSAPQRGDYLSSLSEAGFNFRPLSGQRLTASTSGSFYGSPSQRAVLARSARPGNKRLGRLDSWDSTASFDERSPDRLSHSSYGAVQRDRGERSLSDMRQYYLENSPPKMHSQRLTSAVSRSINFEAMPRGYARNVGAAAVGGGVSGRAMGTSSSNSSYFVNFQ